jgi:hypothetical protein
LVGHCEGCKIPEVVFRSHHGRRATTRRLRPTEPSSSSLTCPLSPAASHGRRWLRDATALPPVFKQREPRMASLFFTCPSTRQQVSTGIETDVQSLRTFWKVTLSVKCPNCVGMHCIPVRETYINNALEDAMAQLGNSARGPLMRLA